jgi:acyl-CoA dehydrogenase-like protein
MSFSEALAEAGLFHLWLPSAMGGPELSPAEFMQVVEAASAMDGSIGWIVANGGGMSRVAGYLPDFRFTLDVRRFKSMRSKADTKCRLDIRAKPAPIRGSRPRVPPDGSFVDWRFSVRVRRANSRTVE